MMCEKCDKERYASHVVKQDVRVGDVVAYRPAFGMGDLVERRVDGMEVTHDPREKYGTPVKIATWNLISQNRVLFTFGGFWAYSSQIEGVVSE